MAFRQFQQYITDSHNRSDKAWYTPSTCRLRVFAPCPLCYNLSHAHFQDLQPPPHSLQTTMPTGAIWTAAEETVFVNFLVDNKSGAGDGRNFKAPTFQQAANHISTLHERGPIKTAKIAHNKWTTVCLLLFLFVFWCSLLSCSSRNFITSSAQSSPSLAGSGMTILVPASLSIPHRPGMTMSRSILRQNHSETMDGRISTRLPWSCHLPLLVPTSSIQLSECWPLMMSVTLCPLLSQLPLQFYQTHEMVRIQTMMK